MALLELIDQWNAVMGVKITEKQLLVPNEEFVLNCITSIFTKLNYSVPLNLKSTDEELARFAKFNLCDCVNQLYGLTDAKNEIFYLDLIEPSPKRTVHLLQNLLNFALYHDMVKEEKLPKLKELGQRLEIKRTRKQQLQMKIEEKKIKGKIEMEEKYKLKEEIVKIDAEIVRAKGKVKKIDQDWQKWEEKIQQLKQKTNTKQMNIEKMQNELVPESLIENLQKEIKTVREETEQLSVVCDAIKESNNAAAADVEKTRKLVRERENLLEHLRKAEKAINPSANGLVDIEKETMELKVDLERAKSTNKHLQATLGCIDNNVKGVKAEIDALIEDYKKSSIETEKKIQNLEDNTAKMYKKVKDTEIRLECLKNDIEDGQAVYEQFIDLIK
uniref:Kinetochore protein Nuf2 n=1 Tax=Nyssomyia neivai TaxID=330878 RepID=A0A1L8DD18_9DIPT